MISPWFKSTLRIEGKKAIGDERKVAVEGSHGAVAVVLPVAAVAHDLAVVPVPARGLLADAGADVLLALRLPAFFLRLVPPARRPDLRQRPLEDTRLPVPNNTTPQASMILWHERRQEGMLCRHNSSASKIL